MKRITLKQCFDTRAYSQNYYPIWRKPLSSASFFLLYFLVNFLKIHNPYIISFATIVFWLFWSLYIAFWYVYIWCLTLLMSYIFDLLDGKLARLQNKQNISARFIDWNYHTLIPSFAYFALWFYVFSHGASSIYIFLATWCIFFFVHKIFLSMLYLNVERDILISKDKYKTNPDYEKSIELQYSWILKNKFIHFFYFYIWKLFIDSTDLLFGLIIFLILGYPKIYIIIAFSVNIVLWIFSFYNKTLSLYSLEEKNRI